MLLNLKRSFEGQTYFRKYTKVLSRFPRKNLVNFLGRGQIADFRHSYGARLSFVHRPWLTRAFPNEHDRFALSVFITDNQRFYEREDTAGIQ